MWSETEVARNQTITTENTSASVINTVIITHDRDRMENQISKAKRAELNVKTKEKKNTYSKHPRSHAVALGC